MPVILYHMTLHHSKSPQYSSLDPSLHKSTFGYLHLPPTEMIKQTSLEGLKVTGSKCPKTMKSSRKCTFCFLFLLFLVSSAPQKRSFSKRQIMPSDLLMRSHQLSLESIVGSEESANDVQGPIGGHGEINGICEKTGWRCERLP